MSDYPIITPRMSARKNTSTLKLFFPCDEGSGNDINDVVGNVIITDTASIEWVDPHVAAVQTIRDAAVGGTFPSIPLGSSCILFTVQECVITGAFVEISLGGPFNASSIVGISPATATIEDINGNNISNRDSVVISGGDTFLLATAYDGTLNLISKYAGVNATAVVKTANDNFDGGIIDSAINLESFCTLNLSSAQKHYGFGLYVYDGGLPEQAVIEEELDAMFRNFLNGHKITSTVL